MINRENDDDIIYLVKTDLDNRTGTAETFNEHILIKLMQLRDTPIENFTFEQKKVDKAYDLWLIDRSWSTETFKSTVWSDWRMEPTQTTSEAQALVKVKVKKSSSLSFSGKETGKVSVGDVYFGKVEGDTTYEGWVEILEVEDCR